jgi:hypothetical protein
MKLTLNNTIIELSEEQVKEIQAQLQAEKESKFFVPKFGERYWYLSVIGINNYENLNCFLDKNILVRQEVYRTKEEAEKADEKRLALMRIKRYIVDKGYEFTPDWGDERQDKYFIFYDYSDKYFASPLCRSCKEALLLPYLSSIKACKDIIENCKEDLLKVFEIE